MNSRDRAAMDRHITGNFGEDQFLPEEDDRLFCEMCGREIPPEDGHSINAPGIPAGEIIACTKCRDDYRNRNRKEEE